MTVLQCGFIASGAGEPDCSKDISSARPVPVSSDVQLTSIYPGGWGFGLAISADGKLYSWGINSATLLGKSGKLTESDLAI